MKGPPGPRSEGWSGCGRATAAQLSQPYDVAITPAGHLVIADRGNDALRWVW